MRTYERSCIRPFFNKITQVNASEGCFRKTFETYALLIYSGTPTCVYLCSSESQDLSIWVVIITMILWSHIKKEADHSYKT